MVLQTRRKRSEIWMDPCHSGTKTAKPVLGHLQQVTANQFWPLLLSIPGVIKAGKYLRLIRMEVAAGHKDVPSGTAVESFVEGTLPSTRPIRQCQLKS